MTKEDVWLLVQAIPRGCVATYGQLAALAGNPRAARGVVWALKLAPPGTPCHRVVNRLGTLAPPGVFGRDLQRALLMKEGVSFLPDGRIDFEKALWRVRYEDIAKKSGILQEPPQNLEDGRPRR